jgi:hypothetical protein
MAGTFLLLGVGYFFIILLTMYKRGSRGSDCPFTHLLRLVRPGWDSDPVPGYWGAGLTTHLCNGFPLDGAGTDWFVSAGISYLRVKSNLWVIFGICWFVAAMTTIDFDSS